jgi:hypothetical protein
MTVHVIQPYEVSLSCKVGREAVIIVGEEYTQKTKLYEIRRRVNIA